MPTYRKLHTKVTQSFDFNEMPDDFTRCLWLLLPLGLDCEGRGIYNASWIKAKLMPLREDVESKQIMAAMEWFDWRGMIVVYMVDGRQYFYVPTFKEYQSGTEKEAKSVLPAPIPEAPPTPELVGSSSGVGQEQVGAAASASASASVNESVKERENVFHVYEQEIGLLTPGISEKIGTELDDGTPPGWIVDAMNEAVLNNARSWAYVATILKRWKKEGRGSKYEDKKPPEPPKSYERVVLPSGEIQYQEVSK